MMARAALFHGVGRGFELVQHDVPEPQGSEILVRVSCCTLCRSDLHTYAGRRIEPTPTVLGHEIVGRIAAFGPEAIRTDARGQTANVGDRVTWAVVVGCGQCDFCQGDLPQKCERVFKYGHMQASAERPLTGGLAEYILLVPGTVWYRVPDDISDRVAAPANCATATVAAMLRSAGSVAGRTVLVLGAGMLGVTACAMSRAAGAERVIAYDAEPACRERALAFGATETELTQKRGADVVLELAGVASSVQVGLSLVRTGGTMVLAGTVAPTEAVPLYPEVVVRRMLTIRGVHNYHPRDLATALDFLAGPARQFPFESLIGDVFALTEVDKAFETAHTQTGRRIAVIP